MTDKLPHLGLQLAGSVCLRCHFSDQYCLLCKKEHCICRGFNEKNHPTMKHEIRGATTGFLLRKSNKKEKKEDMIQITFMAEFDGKINQYLGQSTLSPGISATILTKDTYPVTKDSVRGKALVKDRSKSQKKFKKK